MRPRSKQQFRVATLSEKLPRLTMEEEKWGLQHCLPHLAFRTKSKTHCLDCGHSWASGNNRLLVTILETEVSCPACGTRLHVQDTRRLKETKRAFLGKVQVVEEFQLSRFFDIRAWYKVGQKPSFRTYEVAQIWHNPGGKDEVIGQLLSWYGNFGGELAIRDRRLIDRVYSLWPADVLPGAKVLPIYKRNGFKGNFHGIGPHDLLRAIVSDTKAETLLKAKQFELLRCRMGDRRYDVSQYWDAIKICIRNKYTVKEGITYLDYLKLLTYFKKDVRSPKYVCPKNLKAEHNKLVAAKQVIDKHQRLWDDYLQLTRWFEIKGDKSLFKKPVPLKLEIARLQAHKEELQRRKRAKDAEEKINADQQAYINTHGGYFGIGFVKDNISIVVLQSLNEFFEESDVLKHCAFTNGYYKKADSLCFSARVDGVPTETIELQLSTMRILQSRGLHNGVTPHHQQILDVLSENLPAIRKQYAKLKKDAKEAKMNEELLQTA